MTANDKARIASFLDLSSDSLSGGFRLRHGEHAFCDDLPDPHLIAPLPLPKELPENETAPLNGNLAEDSLEKIAAEIATCKRCGLCGSRTNTVPGEGVAKPLVMVIGEGPGEDEDKTGRPFVGRAGQLLDRILDAQGKIGLSRETNCYIANILKCRPPGNRNPQPDEINMCVPFLVKQIKALRPKIILAAGNTAVKTLLDSTEGITKLRGSFKVFTGTPLMDGDFHIPLLPTFHPSALLRDEGLKAPVWEDMRTLRARLCELDTGYASHMADKPL